MFIVSGNCRTSCSVFLKAVVPHVQFFLQLARPMYIVSRGCRVPCSTFLVDVAFHVQFTAAVVFCAPRFLQMSRAALHVPCSCRAPRSMFLAAAVVCPVQCFLLVIHIPHVRPSVSSVVRCRVQHPGGGGTSMPPNITVAEIIHGE